MNRRHFLRALGGGTAAMGLAHLGLRSPLARADSHEAPKRLLVLSHCHGWAYDGWKLRPPGLDTTAPWEVDLNTLPQGEWSSGLAPLYGHRSRLLPVDGLSLASAELDADGNRHDTGWVHAWTGANADFSGTETRATAASLDQVVADAIARTDRLPSLELSISAGGENGRPIAYAPTGVQLPALTSAEATWDRLFGPSLGDADLALRQQAVVDFAYGEYTAVRGSLPGAAVERLEGHFGLLAQLGERIAGMAALDCPDVPERVTSLSAYDTRFDAMSELIAAAFSCDITRVASLSLGELPTADFGAADLTDDVHKGLAHEVYNDPVKMAAMEAYQTHHALQVARLVALLESVPDVDGRSVMDNTLIVWGSELANGWHGYQHYCPVLIGGDWHFRPGRYLYLPHETPIEILVPVQIDPSGWSTVSGRPHQHLLVSAAHAMGLDLEHLGHHALMGQTGERVDCSGPLPELS